MDNISIIIPLFNEGKRIKKTLNRLKAFTEDRNIEIIFVNDGSTDSTLKILKKERFPYEIISYAKNRGKGYAIKKGFEFATGNIIFFMDGDLAIPLDQMGPFIKKINEDYDIIIGNKKKKDYKNGFRKIASKSFNQILKLLLGLKFNDTQCGFKAFKKAQGKILFSELKEFGFAFDVEILLRAKKKNFKIFEIEVDWHEDVKNSSVHLWKDAFKMFIKIIKIKQYVQ